MSRGLSPRDDASLVFLYLVPFCLDEKSPEIMWGSWFFLENAASRDLSGVGVAGCVLHGAESFEDGELDLWKFIGHPEFTSRTGYSYIEVFVPAFLC